MSKEMQQAATGMLDAAESIKHSAYVISQSVCALAKIEGMLVENQARMARGESAAYGEEAFDGIAAYFGIDHNSVIR